MIKMGKNNKLIFYTEVLAKLNIISVEEKGSILKKNKKKG
jgi:hypothetical protein